MARCVGRHRNVEGGPARDAASAILGSVSLFPVCVHDDWTVLLEGGGVYGGPRVVPAGDAHGTDAEHTAEFGDSVRRGFVPADDGGGRVGLRDRANAVVGVPARLGQRDNINKVLVKFQKEDQSY